MLNQFQEFTGDRRAADISAFHIEKWKLARALDVEQSTVNRELNVIRGMFRRAIEWKLLSASPVARVRKYHTDDARIRVLSEEETQTVLTKSPPDIALLCRATLECLPRLSELLTLRREHIGAGWIEIRRKGGRVDRVNVSPELRTACWHEPIGKASPSVSALTVSRRLRNPRACRLPESCARWDSTASATMRCGTRASR